MIEFLICLMGNTSYKFTCFLVVVYSIAKALESCKIYIKTGDKGSCERILLVDYAPDFFPPAFEAASEQGKRLCYRTMESRAQNCVLPFKRP